MALHAHGADLRATTVKTKLGTLAMACDFDSARCAKWLLDHGAPPMERDSKGDFPGLLAAKHASTECLRHLIAKSIPANARGEHGMTMAMAAALNDNVEALSLLEDHGADFDLRMEGRQIGRQGPRIQDFTAMQSAERAKKIISLAWFQSRKERLELGLASKANSLAPKGGQRI